MNKEVLHEKATGGLVIAFFILITQATYNANIVLEHISHFGKPFLILIFKTEE